MPPAGLEIVICVEHTNPHTALDDRLRGEQAAAVLALLRSPATEAPKRRQER